MAGRRYLHHETIREEEQEQEQEEQEQEQEKQEEEEEEQTRLIVDVEYFPEEKVKTYNVHRKTGDFVIGEAGKIDTNNGQTLEVNMMHYLASRSGVTINNVVFISQGVRYTFLAEFLDTNQISEILRTYFGA